MPVTMLVGQSVVATPNEFDASGNAFAIVPANMTWSTSDATIASMVANADGTATFTAVAAGTVTATVSDTVYSLAASDTITVNPVPVVPASISISWGTPA